MSTSADRPVVTQLTAHHSGGRGGERKAPNDTEAVTLRTVLCFLCPNKNVFRIFVCLMVGKRQSELNEIKKRLSITRQVQERTRTWFLAGCSELLLPAASPTVPQPQVGAWGRGLQKQVQRPNGVTACARARPPGTMRFVLSSGPGVSCFISF